MSPTTTGAKASGSEPVKTPGQIAREAFVGSDNYLAWNQLADGSHERWEHVAATCAALAAPAPVVPEGLRALSEAATQGIWSAAGGTDFRATGLGSPKPIGMTSPAGDGNGLNDRAFIVGLVNWFRDLAATPSKPVGDGGEASAPPAGGGVVPAGWRLVPVEPTEEMQQAGWIDKEDVSPKEIWWAMLAAAPEPAAGGERETTPATKAECVALTGAIRREFGKLADTYGDVADDLDDTCDRVVDMTLNFLSARELPRSILSAPTEAGKAWSEHSPQEIVRRTRCMAGETRDAVVWRDCCDLILERLSAGSEPTPANAGAEGGQS